MAEAPTKVCRCCQQELPCSEFFARAANKDGLYSYCRKCNVIKVRETQARRPDWKEHKREYDRARVARLKDKIAEQGRERYQRNKEKVLAYTREWSARNPERRKAISQNYKHRRRAQERAGISTRELADWKQAQAKVCYWCGVKCARSYHVDHYVPLAKGGKHEASNLVIACPSCNKTKQAKDPLLFARSVGRLF